MYGVERKKTHGVLFFSYKLIISLNDFSCFHFHCASMVLKSYFERIQHSHVQRSFPWQRTR